MGQTDGRWSSPWSSCSLPSCQLQPTLAPVHNAEHRKHEESQASVKLEFGSVLNVVVGIVMDQRLIVVQTVDRNPFKKGDRCAGVKTVSRYSLVTDKLTTLLSAVFRSKCQRSQDQSEHIILLSQMWSRSIILALSEVIIIHLNIHCNSIKCIKYSPTVSWHSPPDDRTLSKHLCLLSRSLVRRVAAMLGGVGTVWSQAQQ